ADVLVGLARQLLPEWDSLDRVDQMLIGARVFYAGAQVNPGARTEERRERGRIERLWQSGQQNQEEAERTVLGGPIEGHPQFLVYPITQPVRPNEHGAGVRGVQAGHQLVLPAAAWGQAPFVQPGLQTVPLQLGGQTLDRCL